MNKKKSLPRPTPDKDEFYLGLAYWMSAKSKDPSTQCGAVIVDVDNRPLGWGYNGPPKQIRDDDVDWSRPSKYPYIVHAEENAINHSCGNLHGSVLYVTGIPCNKCMLTIVNSEISKVVYAKAKTDSGSMLCDPAITEKTHEIARLGNVRLELFPGNLNWMRDRMLFMEKIGVFS